MALCDFRAIYLPYCIEKQDDGTWLVMNREYSPVGFTVAHFPRGDLPVTVKLRGLGRATLEKIAFNGRVERNRVYLYDDGCNPLRGSQHMREYLKKIELLAKLDVP